MAADETGGVTMAIANGVASIVFYRAGTRNAMLSRTWSALPALIASAQAEAHDRVIVLHGAGGHFGAGNDIAEFARLRGDEAGSRQFSQAMADAMLAVENASRPVIAAIEGCCFGASVALALTADFRLAASNSRLRRPSLARCICAVICTGWLLQ